MTFGVLVIGVGDVGRAARFWSKALGCTRRSDGFGGWSAVLVPAGGHGPAIALQLTETLAPGHPRLHIDLHVHSASEQREETDRLVSLGACGVPELSHWP